MLLTRAFVLAAVVAGVVGCSCGESASAPSGAGGTSSGSGGSLGRGGRAGQPSSGGGGTLSQGGGGASTGSAGDGGTAATDCGKTPGRPADIPASFAAVHALGCECTFWLGTSKADFPAMSWATCAPGTVSSWGCETLAIAGYDEGWKRYSLVRSDATNGGAPLVAVGVSRDFSQPTAKSRLWWLDAASSTPRAELASDRSKGRCYAAVPRVASGHLLANVNESEAVEDAGIAGHSGFVLLSTDDAGGVTYLASEPFAGGSAYTPTADAVYGRLLDNVSSGLYRAEGAKPAGMYLDTSPFGSAFPEGSLGKHFVITLQLGGYVGLGVFDTASGFQALLPASPKEDRGAANLGGDGETLVWTDQRKQTGEFEFATNDVFAAPTTTSPTAIAMTQRRLTKAVGGLASGPWAVGCGLAAQRWELTIQVVRLSDGAFWLLDEPLAKSAFSPGAITCEHIYGSLDNGQLMRIRVDQLGEPQPAE